MQFSDIVIGLISTQNRDWLSLFERHCRIACDYWVCYSIHSVNSEFAATITY
ncbi:hypothetical protein PLUTE_a0537 [Pseudoalteromonas luteoviolacea DSM 6061]|nr:hypothetical protein [Pseudoalteromonas luteoviolacea DSM 6061]